MNQYLVNGSVVQNRVTELVKRMDPVIGKTIQDVLETYDSKIQSLTSCGPAYVS